MSFLIALLDSVMIFFLFLCGLCCASVYREWPWSNELFFCRVQTWVHSPVFFAHCRLAAIVFLVITLFSILLRRARILSCDDLSFVSKKGMQIQISNKAINGLIRKIVNTIDGVHSAVVKVYSDRKDSSIAVKIHLNLWEGVSYPEVNEKIQEQVKIKVASEMGIEKIESFTIVLKKIVPKEPTPTLPIDAVAITE
jgi:uncharacterized alkaline shock family protein YloU